MKNLIKILFLSLVFCVSIKAQNITGTGTSSDPYVIWTPVGMDSVRYLFTGIQADTAKYFELGANLNMSSITNFIPLGNTDNPFRGHFDGKYFQISNLNIISFNLGQCGFFGAPTFNMIKRVILKNSSVVINAAAGSGERSVGMLVGYMDDYTNVADCHISNCSISVTNAPPQNHAFNVGILAGKALGTVNRCSVEDCTVTLLQSNNYGTWTNNVGLLIGWAQGVSVDESFATGVINVSTNILSVQTAGLFIAHSTDTEVGWTRNNCYAIGKLTAADGAAGFTSDGLNNYCYSVDTLSAGVKVGFDWNTFTTQIDSTCYFDSVAAGTSTPDLTGIPSAHAKNQTALKIQATFSGWDFSTIWNISPSINQGFPFLRNNLPHHNYSPIGPPTSLILTNPKSGIYSRGNRVDNLVIQWTKLNVDTVYVYLNNHLYTSTTSLMCVVPQDTLRSYTDTMKIKIVGKTKIRGAGTPVVITPPTPVTNPTITGTGTIADPYVLYSAQQYLDLVDTVSQSYRCLSLANDLDFKNITITNHDLVNIHTRAWFAYVEGNGFTIKNFDVIRGQTDSAFTECGLAIFTEVSSLKNIKIDSCDFIYDRPIPAITKVKINDPVRGVYTYMDDTYSEGRQYNFAFNHCYETAISFSGNLPPQISNVVISNSNIYIDLSNQANTWNYSSMAALNSNSRKYADPTYEADKIFVNNVTLFLKLAKVEKPVFIDGVTTWAGKISNSYFNGSITFDMQPDTLAIDQIPSVSINGFGRSSKTVNCYSRGTITFEGSLNPLISVSMFTPLRATPSMTNVFIDTVNYRQFMDFNVLHSVADSLIDSFFARSSGVMYYNFNSEHCYSDMSVVGNVKAIPFYQKSVLNASSLFYSTIIDSVFNEYISGNYENQFAGSLLSLEQEYFTGVWNDGALDCYYNTDLLNVLIINPQPLMNNVAAWGRTETQMKVASTFANWDFYGDTGWRIRPGVNNGFPNLTIDSTYSFTYSIVATDSGYVILPPIYDDAYIKIISTNPTKLQFTNKAAAVSICALVESSGVDSVKFYYSFADTLHWTYFGRDSLKHDLGVLMDTTNICLSVPVSNQFGDMYLKIEGIIDTAKYNLTLSELGWVTLVGGSQNCAFWGFDGTNFVSNRDPSCGWNPSINYRLQGSISIAIGTLAPFVTYTSSTVPVTGLYNEDLAFALKVAVNPLLLQNRRSQITGSNYYGSSPIYIKNRGYYFKVSGSGGSIVMQDFKNNLEYEVYSINSSINNYLISGYSVTSMLLAPTADNDGMVLYNFNPVKGGYYGGSALAVSVFPFINMAVPNGIVFKGLNPPAGKIPHAILKLTGGVQFISTEFRGIYPKAIISVIPAEGK